MSHRRSLRLQAALLFPFTSPALAQADPAATPADKSGYTLFDPTPDALMRPLQTDRPGKSFSPFTVDAGHVQVESDSGFIAGTTGCRMAALPAPPPSWTRISSSA